MKPLRISLVGILSGISVYAYLHYAHIGSLPLQKEAVQNLIIAALAGAATFMSWQLLAFLLDQKLSWRKTPGVKLLLLTLACWFGFELLMALVYFSLPFLGIELKGSLSDLLLKTENPFYTLAIRLRIIVFSIVAIFSFLQFAWYSYRYYTSYQLMESRLLNEQAELEQNLLQEQLSPHYLFNSLNTISSLVGESAEKTEEYIRKTADSLQYILACKGKKLVSIKEELSLLEAFTYQMRIRYGNSFRLTNNIPPAYFHWQLPPLTLQLLVENALKHNQHSEKSPLNIELEWKKEGRLLVRNALIQQVTSPENSTKTGLKNLEKRFSYLQVSPPEVHRGEHQFEVEVSAIPPHGQPEFELDLLSLHV